MYKITKKKETIRKRLIKKNGRKLTKKKENENENKNEKNEK